MSRAVASGFDFIKQESAPNDCNESCMVSGESRIAPIDNRQSEIDNPSMRTVYVVPHFHWDREWYQPHELFRWRLVQAIDEILDHMEAHPEYRCFTLDGQTIVIEDYLELRPENEERLRAMIESGRIVIGPWLVQPDEFLPSGESHIRSLQRGIRFANRLGGCLSVGHCADQFGHIAQMPQLMSQLGLKSACLWRGVPDSIPGWSFQWQGPDGTRLPVLYLRNSYSSGWRLPHHVEDLLERTRRQERERRDDEPALLMNGTDHSRFERQVPEILANATGRGYDYQLVTLGEYEQAQFAAGIDDVTWCGELRSPDRSNVLVGVLSARMNIKQRDFQVSGGLEKYAEPLELLAHLHGGPDGMPALKQAWRLLLENSPHDSICGCSVDQTHREMMPRYDRAEQLADQVARESLWYLTRRLEAPEAGGLVVFRPVAHAPAVVEADVPDSWEAEALRLPDGTTVPCTLEPLSDPIVLTDEDVSPRGAGRHLDFLREDRFDAHYIEDMQWELDGRQVRVTTTVGNDLNVVDDAEVRESVREVAANNLADTGHVGVIRSGRKRLRAVLPATDTVGVQVIEPIRAPTARESTDRGSTDSVRASTVTSGKDWIANEFYEVRFRKGRLTIKDKRTGLAVKGANTFVDEGDRGDEYNADILPDGVFAVPTIPCETEAIGDEARLYVYQRLEPGRELASGRVRRRRRLKGWMGVITTISLFAGLPRADFRVMFGNSCQDHRLRALFPLPFPVPHAITENQFHVAERSLEVAAWNGVSAELPPTTFPQKTFAAFESDGLGVAVFNKGLQEGEVVRDRKGRQAYALTLLRCVGWLSRPDLTSRRGGAGPTIATPDAQMPGTHTFEYSLMTYEGNWHDAGVQAMAHSFAYPPLAFATNVHEGSLGREAPLATITPGVVPTALARSEEDGAPYVRAYNATGVPAEASIAVPAAGEGAGLVDLLERHQASAERADGAWSVPLRPWEIATVRFGRR